MMKKAVSAFTMGIALSAMSLNANAGKGWEFLPGLEDDYQPEPTLSLAAGQMYFEDTDGNILGAELSFNCPLIQPPTNKIRQNLSFTNYSETGVDVYNVELNTHYVMEVSPKLWLGAGPGLGVLVSNPDVGDSQTRFGLGLGASVHYEGLGPMFLGAEFRGQITTEKDGADANNNRFMVKVGYNFMR